MSEPPVAKKVPKVDVVHGDRRQDDYFWLRQKDDPEVLAYLRAENAYTDEALKPAEAFRETLYQEMLARIKEDDTTVPFRRGRHFYYSRTEKGKQYPIHCRKPGSLEAPEEVTLDLNRIAEGHAFVSLGAYTVSDDGRLLAYTVDFTGFREYTLHVKDLQTGELLPERIEKVAEVAASMLKGRFGSAVVMEGAWLVGIFTERDVLRAAASADPSWSRYLAENPGERRQGLIISDWRQCVAEGETTSYVGDVVAIVAAESRAAAREAAALVEVEYDVLEPVTDPAAALATGAPAALPNPACSAMTTTAISGL